ncbi:hypothetical protein sos41_40140 [Alphaproteobacteria bacterium SO-S41]|nr:hypothetical protein sos41_40140 [Alphaproteobacteria bacterium SO-S41]
MVDWDDLKFFLAAARAGGFKEAATRVGVDATTVGRRVQRLETALRRTLFVRAPGALRLTASGLHLREIAVRMEAEVEAAAGSRGDHDVTGTIRISVSEGFGTTILAPELQRLVSTRPGLAVELVTNPLLSPEIREVDVAITPQHLEMRHVETERLANFELGLYTSNDYLQRYKPVHSVDDLTDVAVVGYIDDLHLTQWRYLDQVPQLPRPMLSSNSLRAQIAMLQGGCGIGILPHFLARGQGLTPLLGDQVLLKYSYWISSHEEIAQTARIRAIKRWVTAAVATSRHFLEPYATAAEVAA